MQTTNIKAFKCESCEKCFQTKGLLLRHEPIHISGKLFICDLCDFNTNYESTLAKHLEQKHGRVSAVNSTVKSKSNPNSKSTSNARIRSSAKMKTKCDYCDYSTARN